MQSKINKLNIAFDDDFFVGKVNKPLSMERGGKGNVATDRNNYSQKETKLFTASRQFDRIISDITAQN